MTHLTMPNRPTAASRAAMLILTEGPMKRSDLFTRIDFGAKESGRESCLKRAVSAGWLTRSEHGTLDITAEARELLATHDELEPPPKLTGTVATSRMMNVYERPAYKPAKRIVRHDVPEWSIRPAGFRICTIA